MNYKEIKKEMDKIERKLQNINDSFNPESGMFIQHEQHVGKLMEEHGKLEAQFMLAKPYSEIEYDRINKDEGVLMSINEFRTECGLSTYNDDSGIAFYVSNETKTLETLDVYLKPSWALSRLHRKDFNEVVWYYYSEFNIDNQSSQNQSFDQIEEDF